MNEDIKRLVELADEFIECGFDDRQNERKLRLIGEALTNPAVGAFVDSYKEGWNGGRGHFARVLCRAMAAVEYYSSITPKSS